MCRYQTEDVVALVWIVELIEGILCNMSSISNMFTFVCLHYVGLGSGTRVWWWRRQLIVITMTREWDWDHHTEHLLAGFNVAFEGQLNVSLNSFKFDNGPVILNLAGLCEPTMTRNFNTSGLNFPHQTFAEETQNNCRVVRFKPGNLGSSPFLLAHSL